MVKALTSGAKVKIDGPENFLVKETIVSDTKQETVSAQKSKMMGGFYKHK